MSITRIKKPETGTKTVTKNKIVSEAVKLAEIACASQDRQRHSDYKINLAQLGNERLIETNQFEITWRKLAIEEKSLDYEHQQIEAARRDRLIRFYVVAIAIALGFGVLVWTGSVSRIIECSDLKNWLTIGSAVATAVGGVCIACGKRKSKRNPAEEKDVQK